jgi:hypothetical protein
LLTNTHHEQDKRKKEKKKTERETYLAGGGEMVEQTAGCTVGGVHGTQEP